jgi:hypothetical protein
LLEALTIVVPAGGTGAAVSFEVEAANREGGVHWTDAAGRHRVVTGAASTLQLPAGLELSTGLTWWVESANSAADDHEGGLIAALPTEAPQAPADLQAITHLAEQSGRMIVLANIRGRRWEKLGVAQPRRG